MYNMNFNVFLGQRWLLPDLSLTGELRRGFGPGVLTTMVAQLHSHTVCMHRHRPGSAHGYGHGQRTATEVLLFYLAVIFYLAVDDVPFLKIQI